ncbi:F0F1 ATP synthase subunit B [Thiomicrorhabdus lithotrophica]|uniref:ATP synthase subunit b n=1 Tax=Thiomicrorhabdus lithotrophica TaxID=2949997 RepID=A0ABY8C9H7_9GAMM|nr:F0F1 ATP synthase subunit B [Thiomicrorhabdus lithotrophica]MEA1988300.1 F0F1 ATP synthase subunit B [Pseudomonadota bacterium]WEJ62618.1 F0F1 ATP synthase subunit B [Thiomicrorhabdus lithotrophica]
MSINATLLIQMIAFMLLIWFVNKVLWAPLSKLMEDRQKKIADGLSAAEKGKHELELAEQKAKDVLKDAKTQAQNILGQAEKRGSEIVEDAKVKATEEADRIKASAQAEIEQEVSRAREGLRKEVASIAISGAEKILRKEVDAAAHNDMLETLVKSI